MDVDFCPNCKKAGLRYERVHIATVFNRELQAWRHTNPDAPELVENRLHRDLGEKWCPRCKLWVAPEAHDVMS